MLIECDALSDLLIQQQTNVVVIDATVQLASPQFDGDYRVESGYMLWKAEHIPTAIHVDQYQDFADTNKAYSFAPPDVATAQNFLRHLGIRQDSQVVIYDCRDGIWAARLWWVLASFGVYSRILNGGLSAWKRATYPVIQGEPAYNPSITIGDIILTSQSGYWADINDVEQALQSDDSTLVCALGQAQFLGTAVSRYARRGSIPDSINIPARNFIGTDNKYIAEQDILKILADYDLPQQHTILYCGGGISACVLAVAIRLVSDTAFSIYDGSLQQWAQQPQRPLFVG
ncbi:hypothetical protein BJI46_04685 [Acinetobacter qingfengensis]|uniref:Rhodanese domain-containing protein n=2 Tax=Acinetobacter qingfengensis TaxID=1262585 RepID=A0A1E7R338_9GAMM|nr:hypothetical protein BJI46_04685 [Acinetobacter qingfengensis]